MKKRASGILMHISSLPSKYGIGDFGVEAYKFVDFLVDSKMSYWQVLPLGMTSYGDSPYQSPSLYAGNPYFIDLDEFRKLKYLSNYDIKKYKLYENADEVDYGLLYENKYALLKIAYKNSIQEIKADLDLFLIENQDWLSDFALFMSLKKHHNNVSLLEFDLKYRKYNSSAVLEFEKTNQDEIYFWIFTQYYFFKQYNKLKAYANSNGIKIIGDIPIYCSVDSVEVWRNPELFKLNDDLSLKVVAGVPPDYFAPLGQLWGNPVYNWKNHQTDNYKFWISRIKFNFKLYDTVRIDHFRGFDEYYEIAADAKDATVGQWQKGPGLDLFKQIENELGNVDIIAEDLGLMNDSVRQLVLDTKFPNMKVMMFGLNSKEDSEHLPHNYYRNMIGYIGTHDNEVLYHHLKTLDKDDYKFMSKYFNVNKEAINYDFIRALYASNAYLVIISIQDIIFDDSVKRMNTPSTMENNWTYRIKKNSLLKKHSRVLADFANIYRRV